LRIFEINTWIWLSELAERYGRNLTLGSIPDEEWDALVPYCFDAVWLMGVWQRSPEGRVIAQRDATLREACRSVAAHFCMDDIVASPYCVRGYVVDDVLGGAAGLAAARAQLARRNMKLILDFVPNHTAPDHPWATMHQEYYVTGTREDLEREPGRFFLAAGDTVLARGALSRTTSDVWEDTAQLDAFSHGYRNAAVQTLLDIANQCDGVRCDMAMLMLNRAFSSNWSVSAVPEVDFWIYVIETIRGRYPSFLFIAESYGNTEWALQKQGFDFCYDKDKLYERLAHGDAESVRQHVRGCSPEFLAGLVHFLENHDEAPVTEYFRPAGRHQLAALAIATLPGASLWYDRQFEGRFGKLPVQLGRSLAIRSYYRKLLRATAHPAICHGQWSWCKVEPEDTIIAWCWRHEDARVLVVLNLSDAASEGHVTLPLEPIERKRYAFCDLMSGESYGTHAGCDLYGHGLFVQCLGWECHLFEILPSA
jgi:hypothetical protein